MFSLSDKWSNVSSYSKKTAGLNGLPVLLLDFGSYFVGSSSEKMTICALFSSADRRDVASLIAAASSNVVNLERLLLASIGVERISSIIFCTNFGSVLTIAVSGLAISCFIISPKFGLPARRLERTFL